MGVSASILASLECLINSKLYYKYLETDLAEVLANGHTPAEVASVFKHFQQDNSTPTREITRAGNGFPDNNKETNPAGKGHQQKGETYR